MKYLHFKKKTSDIFDYYAELRINIIRVHNAFCPNKIEEDGRYCLDLFEICSQSTVDIQSIADIALLLEGTSGAYEDFPDEVHLEALEELSKKLEVEMAKLP